MKKKYYKSTQERNVFFINIDDERIKEKTWSQKN